MTNTKWRVQVKSSRKDVVVVTHKSTFKDEKLARDYFDTLETALGLVELQVRRAGASRYKAVDKKGTM